MDIEAAIAELNQVLWQDVDQSKSFPTARPVLAHYTSLECLEKILLHNELWFSHPFAMNDSDELSFGVRAGRDEFEINADLKRACVSEKVYEALRQEFSRQWQMYEEGALDTYVFCLSQHDKDDTEGRLPMWTQYADDGKGVAVVISTDKLNSIEAYPNIILGPVEYATRQERREWLKLTVTRLSQTIEKHRPNEHEIGIFAYIYLYRIIYFSLFTKHKAFLNEDEWRAVYVRPFGPTEHLDQSRLKLFDSMLGYDLGPKGVQPKFKFNCAKMPDTKIAQISQLIDYVILGPLAATSAFKFQSIKRMLVQLGRPELADSLVNSEAPYRGVS